MIDNNNNFYNKLILFWSKLKKQGFTLAEALIITVMTGYCLLPILGTMQNAQSRTQEYDHQSKMQLYTRSRLTEEIANAAFDHTSINTDTEYHYIVYLDRGTKHKKGEEKNATLIELPKTTIEPEELKKVVNKTHWKESTALDLLDLNKDDYEEPYLNIVNMYKTTVETSDTPTLEYDGSTSTENETPKALLGIVVKTCLLQSPEGKYEETNGMLDDSEDSIQVPPVTLFSFVNLPTVSDEMIWLVDSVNYKVYGVDSISRGVNSIKLPEKVSETDNADDCKPRYISVHPSLKLLACAANKYLYLINIDKKGGDYGKYIIYNYPNHIHENGGMAFRPDGKYLFICPHHFTSTEPKVDEFNLIVYKVDYNIDNTEPQKPKLIWESTDTTLNPKFDLKNPKGSLIKVDADNKIVGFLPANDGNLYVAYNNKNIGITRYPMYSSEIEEDLSSLASETIVSYRAQKAGESDEDYAKDENNLTEDINSIDVSPDGSRLAIIAGNDLYIYDTKNGKKLISQTISSEVSGNNIFEPNKVTFSALSNSNQTKIYDNTNLILTVTNKLKDKDSIAYVFYYDSNAKEIKELRKITNSGNKGGNLIINSPDDLSVVMSDQEKPHLYFGTIGKNDIDEDISEANSNLSPLSNGSDNVKPAVDMQTNKRDILAVAAANKIKLYDLKLLKPIEDIEFSAKNTITSLAMNPHGNMLLTGFGSGIGVGDTGFSYFNLNDLSDKNTGDGFGKKVIFDDRTPNMAFSLKYPNNTGNNKNAFWNVDTPESGSDSNWTGAESTYERRNFLLHSEWKRLDLIGMPRGGAMALYGKSDGSSMLEWIGRRNWDQDPAQIGKYKLFARWTRIPEKTPYPSVFPNFDSKETDGGEGTVVRSRRAIPEGIKYDSVSLITGTWSTTTKRFITPLIIEYSTHWTPTLPPLPYIAGEVIDYAESLELEQDKPYTNLSLKWKNGGVAGSDCFIAFWNGKVGGIKNGGVVKFDRIKNDTCSFYSDIYESIGITGYLDKDSFSNYSDLQNSEFDSICKNGNDSKRDYAIQFKCSSISQFPPLYSKKLAISPDCGTLAILKGDSSASKEEDKKPVINLYDFNNQIYGPETQVEGLLVDYREANTSSSGGDTWPYESESVFNKIVPNETRFATYGDESEPNIPSFASATTKYETWESYRAHPANYYVRIGGYVDRGSGDNYIDEIKQYSSKRFFGYYRPEINANYMQSTSSKDIRFFFNGIYLNGRKDNSIYTSGGGGTETFNPFNYPIYIQIKAYNTTLFQKDEAYKSSGCLGSNVFIASESSKLDDIGTKTSHPTYPTCDENQIGNSFNINSAYINDIHYINSSDTYILYNKPSYIASFTAQTTEGTAKTLSINDTNMLFSRDKAKPVLYIADNSYLWAFYKKALVRFKINNADSTENIYGLAISGEGNKLVYGTGSSGVYNLRFNNISNPDESKFTTTNSVVSIGNTKEDYLGKIEEIPAKELNPPYYLATKPYVSYKSSKSGGDFKPIADSISFNISNNSVAVASGGIYLVGNGSKNIALFNPSTTVNTITNYNDALKMNANSVAVTAYDDTIYTFGNTNVSGDDKSGITQSYNVNTKESMSSTNQPSFSDPTDNYNDSYQVNLGAVDANQSNFSESVDNYYSSTGAVRNPQDAFTLIDYAYAFSQGETWPSYVTEADIIIKYCLPLSVNKIKVSNNNYEGFTNYSALDQFELLYLDKVDSTYKSLGNFSIGEHCSSKLNGKEFSLDTEGNTYQSKEFKLVLKTFLNIQTEIANKNVKSGSNTDRTIVSLIQLWRTGVKRLTPIESELNSTYYGKDSFTWSNPKLSGNVKISTSSYISARKISDIFAKNTYSNNNMISGTQGWENDSGPDKHPWIKISLDIPEEVCAVRFAQDNSIGMIKILEFYGTNDDSIANADSLNLTNWEQINFSDDNPTFTVPRVHSTFITAELKPTKRYKHYLFYERELVNTNDKMRIIGFELYAKKSTLENASVIDSNYLTSMLDDNLSEVKANNGAACSTPYGLVYSGGLNKDNNAVQTSLLYWPHAINKYDGTLYQYGIPRSLPGMVKARANHALVWHKGKIYAIGGRSNNGNSAYGAAYFIEVLDYNKKMAWETYPKPYKYVNGASDSSLIRFNHGACSFGDEIFIFGGEYNSDTPHSAIAFNPETGVIRQLTDMGDSNNLNPCVAVPFGSKIYIFGNDTTGSHPLKILEYTP